VRIRSVIGQQAKRMLDQLRPSSRSFRWCVRTSLWKSDPSQSEDSRFVEYQVETLVGQRIFGLALGYEDLLDHDAYLSRPMLTTWRHFSLKWRGRAFGLPGASTETMCARRHLLALLLRKHKHLAGFGG
jgi:hypothetical protein